MGVGAIYANERISDMTSPMGFMATPNLKEAGGSFPLGVVCFGDVSVDRTHSLDVCADDLIHAVLTSTFNTDYFYWSQDNYRCDLLMDAYNKVTNTKLAKLEKSDKKWWDEYINLKSLSTRNEEQKKRFKELDSKKPVIYNKVQAARGSSFHKFMLGWELLSEEISVGEFTKQIVFPRKTTYQHMVDFLHKKIEGYDGR